MSEDGSADWLFRALSWLSLLAYPAAMYCTWTNTLVDHEMSPLLTFAPSLPVAMVLYGTGTVFRRIVGGPLLLLRREQTAQNGHTSEATHQMKAIQHRFLARAWKIVEVFLLSVLGWTVVSGERFFPASLFGQGDSASMFDSGRRFVPWHLAAYHAVRFAYLLEWWIFEDGLDRPYLTMHHIATSILLCCAVLAGHAKIGSLIIFLHDVPNVPLQILVWMQQLRVPSFAVIAAYVASLCAWGHFTLYSFPVEVCWPSFTKAHRETFEWKIYWTMFGLLIVHHVYAFVRLLAYIPRFIKSPNSAVADAAKETKND